MPTHYAEVLVDQQDLTIAVHPGQEVLVNVGDDYSYFAPATLDGIAHIHLMQPLPAHYLIRVSCDLLPAAVVLYPAVQSA
ncbi:hypothetical protein [Lacticaseibacillus sp. N501-2]|uniref:hypothetical protein n=1 Tax=Lacticaseibacillus salsurae TaxID=3367729 RepID=UPI0038B3DBB2